MPHFGWRNTRLTRWLLVLGVAMLVEVGSAAAATETRVFSITVDNKPAGTHQVTIDDKGDGTYVVQSRANVRVRVLVVTYVYTYSGTEVWKGPRLQSLQSQCNDNGKRYQVTVRPDGQYLRVNANGAEHLARADAWLTGYWRLPEAHHRGQNVPIVDCDTGRDITARLTYVGEEHVHVAGRQEKCTHYHLAGGPYPVDLWFDGHERLVRQAFVEQGHQTVLHAVSVGR